MVFLGIGKGRDGEGGEGMVDGFELCVSDKLRFAIYSLCYG